MHQALPELQGSLISRSHAVTWALPYRAIEPIAMILDALTIVVASAVSGLYYHRIVLEIVTEPTQFFILGGVVASLFIPFCRNSDLYSPVELLNLRSQLSGISIIWFSVIFVLAGGAFALKAGDSFSRGSSISFVFVGLVALFSMRVLWRLFLDYGLVRGLVSDRSVALIADPYSDDGIVSTLAHHGISVSQYFKLPTSDAPLSLRQAAIDRTVASIRGSDAREVIVTADLDRYQAVADIVDRLKQLPLPVLFVPIGPAAELLTRPHRAIGVNRAFEVQHSPQSVAQQAVKRATDLSIALLGLIVLSPVLLAIGILIKLDSRGPAIFRQRRSGFNGREFIIYKFRTMTVQEDGDQIAQAVPRDSRVTRVGRFLRRFSIDELPQLLNVLGGSMSLVGPRPHAIAHDSEYNKLVANYALRHHVKPGLTGWAQVHGYRGRTATREDMERRIKLDLWYLDNWSFFIDLKIIALTCFAILKSDAAY